MVAVLSIASRAGVVVRLVRCGGGHRGWSAPEGRSSPELVLVRRGWFRRRTRAGVFEADPAVGYLSLPDEEETFAHPGGGDVCTAIQFAPSLWASLFGEHRPATPAVYVDAALEFAHRRFIASTRQADSDYALPESLLALTRAAIGPAPQVGTQAAPHPGARGTDRDIVARARIAIVERHPAAGTLLSLAELLHVSPFRLSRAFTREVGVPLTRYRNRVRVGLVLERLEAGDTDLAGLAADLGFADQAHLTRTVKEHVGHPPAALRRLLGTTAV
ncbi:helix-turn-helix domain-containing protein [Amycolatopsis sp. NPDC006125]|uniref:helix-turn-helix domain-containing protein n=1 Tax=Amycolatopsis sp. NPDC006125 TaxID=3156730 RepID=UPI0033A8255E